MRTTYTVDVSRIEGKPLYLYAGGSLETASMLADSSGGTLRKHITTLDSVNLAKDFAYSDNIAYDSERLAHELLRFKAT